MQAPKFYTDEESRLPEPKYTYELRPGSEFVQELGDDTIGWWLRLANDESRGKLERVSAIMVLLDREVPLEVRRRDG